MTTQHNVPDSSNDQSVEQKNETDSAWLARIQQEQGTIPGPLQFVSMRPGTVSTLLEHKNQIFNDGPLSRKEQALVALSSAIALKSPQCARTQAINARKAGASQSEVVQATLISAFVAGMSPLRIAFQAIGDQAEPPTPESNLAG